MANGGYGFTVGSVSGYTSSPSSGTVTVSGSNVNQGITFTVVGVTMYTVTFTETNLPTGTSWTVTLNGNPESSTGSSIAFSGIANGTYPFSVHATGYVATPASGSVSVSGGSVSQGVSFQSGTVSAAIYAQTNATSIATVYVATDPGVHGRFRERDGIGELRDVVSEREREGIVQRGVGEVRVERAREHERDGDAHGVVQHLVRGDHVSAGDGLLSERLRDVGVGGVGIHGISDGESEHADGVLLRGDGVGEFDDDPEPLSASATRTRRPVPVFKPFAGRSTMLPLGTMDAKTPRLWTLGTMDAKTPRLWTLGWYVNRDDPNQSIGRSRRTSPCRGSACEAVGTRSRPAVGDRRSGLSDRRDAAPLLSSLSPVP